MMASVPLPSDGHSGDIDFHLRVSAGPGAGKTFWLANHVKRVVRESERLTPASRVLCVSYTNIAVAELTGRLGTCGDRVEVSTIHAFLYKFVLRPYAHLLKDPSGAPLVNHPQIDGHEEHRPRRDRIQEWLDPLPIRPFVRTKLLGTELEETKRTLARTRWWPTEDGNWELQLRPGKPQLGFPSSHLTTYKPVYWQHGVVDHDDVIHLSRRLLQENPCLVDFLSARFPYVFIDEFQDTQPAQTDILLRLAASGSIVGVIGDVQQSIYGFTNARPEDFHSLKLHGLRDFHIENNRRSTQTITSFLNEARKDALIQVSLRTETGTTIKVMCGPHAETIKAIRATAAGGPRPVFLTYRNNGVAELKRAEAGLPSGDPWKDFEGADANRHRFIFRLMQAGELARRKQVGLAVKKALECLGFRNDHLGRLFTHPNPVSKLNCHAIAVSLLECDRDVVDNETLANAYLKFSKVLSDYSVTIPAITTGRPKTFASAITVGELRGALTNPDASVEFRTIHSVKGAEFDTVAVFFPSASLLTKCLRKGTGDHEELRVHYVGMSRAKDGLILCLPEPPPIELVERLTELGVEIEYYGIGPTATLDPEDTSQSALF